MATAFGLLRLSPRDFLVDDAARDGTRDERAACRVGAPGAGTWRNLCRGFLTVAGSFIRTPTPNLPARGRGTNGEGADQMAEDVTVRINADTQPFQDALQNLERLSSSFGSQLSGALKSAAVSGKDLDEILRRIGLNLAGMALEQGLKPLQSLAGGCFQACSVGSRVCCPSPRAACPAMSCRSRRAAWCPSPSYFPMGRNVGLMGEAGPEAILPLQRSADGRLGVAASGGGAGVNVVFNVTTPGCDVLPQIRSAGDRDAGAGLCRAARALV